MSEVVSPVEAAGVSDDVTSDKDDSGVTVRERGESPLYELRSDEINALLRARAPLVVMLAGDVNAGKTSCIASLTILLLAGPVAGSFFAGGATLHGLARMALSVSVQGKVEHPSLARTPRGGIRGQHMLLTAEERVESRDILFLDMAGEDYRSAASGDAIELLAPAKRADVFVLFVDGERLLDEGDVQEELAFLTNLARRIVDNDMLRAGCNVVLAFTKTDLWGAARTPMNARDYIKARLATTFKPFDITVAETAAVPTEGDTAYFAHGIEELLRHILRATPLAIDIVSTPDLDTINIPQYLRYGS